jgi:hypothetical protein
VLPWPGPAFVHLDDVVHQSQANAQRAVGGFAGLLHLREHAEDMVDVLGLQADTVVANGQHHLFSGEFKRNRNQPVGGRVLDGVGQ